MTAGATRQREQPPTVLVLHPDLLIADTVAVFLTSTGVALDAAPTDDLGQVLDQGSMFEILVADRRCIPPGLSWHQFGNSREPHLPLLVVLGDPFDTPGIEQALVALRLGARAWVPHDASIEMLAQALATVRSGQLWLPRDRVATILSRLVQPTDALGFGQGLTDRERSVLELLGAGKGTKQIADLLFLSPNTVRTHRQNLFRKLGVHSALEAAAWVRKARVDEP